MHQLACTEENLPANTDVVDATADTEVVYTSTNDVDKGVPGWA